MACRFLVRERVPFTITAKRESYLWGRSAHFCFAKVCPECARRISDKGRQAVLMRANARRILSLENPQVFCLSVGNERNFAIRNRQVSGSSPLVGSILFKYFPRSLPTHHFRAMHGTSEPFTGWGDRVRLSLSSTWGRADQQTSHDSNESGAFCFARDFLPRSTRSHTKGTPRRRPS